MNCRESWKASIHITMSSISTIRFLDPATTSLPSRVLQPEKAAWKHRFKTLKTATKPLRNAWRQPLQNRSGTFEGNCCKTTQKHLKTTATKPLRNTWKQPLQKTAWGTLEDNHYKKPLRNIWRQPLQNRSETLEDNFYKTTQEHLKTTIPLQKTAWGTLEDNRYKKLLGERLKTTATKPLRNAWRQPPQPAQECLKATAPNRSGMLEDNWSLFWGEITEKHSRFEWGVVSFTAVIRVVM